ncbi:trihelix transcription factor ASIL2 [Malania oleifera]|uniref:trihelix transcription factor ASIL2 n=1 Tax=Malania oleifera TaxID=397392 RepID=UPI0025AE5BFF|nr:trihelix transcription factor ASIL2 [Malania oleifera]
MAASSPPPQDTSHPSAIPPPLPAPPISASSRRLPPPCWSHDETVALIDSYRDKWYSLRRGNLKAPHWQEVADAVSRRCPLASPPKTSVQCRHKMEKLRKRYRTELQRSLSTPNRHRFTSSWVHFKRMHSMEKGPGAVASGSDGPDDDDDDDDENDYANDVDDDMNGDGGKHGFPYNRNVNSSMSNGVGGGGGRSAFRIRIPGGSSSMAPSGMGFRPKNHENPNSNFGSRVLRDVAAAGGLGAGKKGGKREEEGDAVVEMVAALKVLGDGFMRMEQMKMEMAREIEAMRMEMEMKRTEMILESQQRIVEAFAKGFLEKKKKAKRMPSPES